jgi:hypothetical protein
MRIDIRRAAWAAAVCLAMFASAEAADEKKKAEKKPPSECAGLDLAACGAKAQCSWIKEITMKNGKKRKAYCRKKPTRATETKKPT